MSKDEIPTCNVCQRLHRPDQPCPLRIANAYMMQPQALERLTDADKTWMAEHKDFSILDLVEGSIASTIK